MGYKSNFNNVKSALTQAELRALEMIGLYVEGEAKVLCPVDTGSLRSSIDHKVDTSDKAVIIGSNVEYAGYVEKGTSRQRAQPYLAPAAENNIKNIKQIVDEEMMKL